MINLAEGIPEPWYVYQIAFWPEQNSWTFGIIHPKLEVCFGEGTTIETARELAIDKIPAAEERIRNPPPPITQRHVDLSSIVSSLLTKPEQPPIKRRI